MRTEISIQNDRIRIGLSGRSAAEDRFAATDLLKLVSRCCGIGFVLDFGGLETERPVAESD